MTEQVVDAQTGIVRCSHRKVAIIGAGQLRIHAPWTDTSWCFWALNEIGQPRQDRHFELHPMDVQRPGDLGVLLACEEPTYLLDLCPELVPNGVRYPLEQVLVATGGRSYFTCTFAYQVALAIAEEFEEIGLWGVDLDLGTARERLVEKPCLEYWLGLAEGRGIKVTMPTSTTLLRRNYLYGYAYQAEKADIERVVSAFPNGPRPETDVGRILSGNLVCPVCLEEMGPVD